MLLRRNVRVSRAPPPSQWIIYWKSLRYYYYYHHGLSRRVIATPGYNNNKNIKISQNRFGPRATCTAECAGEGRIPRKSRNGHLIVIVSTDVIVRIESPHPKKKTRFWNRPKFYTIIYPYRVPIFMICIIYSGFYMDDQLLHYRFFYLIISLVDAHFNVILNVRSCVTHYYPGVQRMSSKIRKNFCHTNLILLLKNCNYLYTT